MVEAFMLLHDESVEFTVAVKGAWLRFMSKQGTPEDIKLLARHARRIQDHLDTLKGLTAK